MSDRSSPPLGQAELVGRRGSPPEGGGPDGGRGRPWLPSPHERDPARPAGEGQTAGARRPSTSNLFAGDAGEAIDSYSGLIFVA
jgi:hypothetical protein